MPRQFFTLKSILTAPPGSSLGGAPVSATAGIGTNAVLETSSGQQATPVAVHALQVFDVDDMPEGKEVAELHRFALRPPDEVEEYDQELVGAPSTVQDEVYLGEGEEFSDDEDQEIIESPDPPQAIALPPPQPQPVPQPPPLPPPPPPVARFANLVTYDGAFEPVRQQMGQILGQSFNEVMRLRARAAEAFERKAEEMLADLACTVLGRELRTEPADLANLVAQMRARLLGESAVQIRVSVEDAGAVSGPIVVDESLGFGDLVFETDDGEIDLRLGTRIAAMLRSQHVEIE